MTDAIKLPVKARMTNSFYAEHSGHIVDNNDLLIARVVETSAAQQIATALNNYPKALQMLKKAWPKLMLEYENRELAKQINEFLGSLEEG